MLRLSLKLFHLSIVALFLSFSLLFYYFHNISELESIQRINTLKPKTTESYEIVEFDDFELRGVNFLKRIDKLYKPEEYEPLMERMFQDVYSSKRWGRYQGRPYSGTGSLPMLTVGYRKLINDLLIRYPIRSVVDVACGLWTFSDLIDWKPINRYVGLDIVPYVIKTNQKYVENNRHKFGGKFQFRVMSLTSKRLPAADLLICKDALQHLPLAVIKEFLKQVLKVENGKCKFKYILITNDMDRGFQANNEITVGDWRFNTDLRKPPFNLKQLEILYEFPKSASRYHKTTVFIDMAKLGCTDYAE